MNKGTKDKKKQVLTMCVCPTCLSYKNCSKDERRKELGFCFPTIGKSKCITKEKGCLCPSCPVTKMMDLKHNYYCTRGREEEQKKGKAKKFRQKIADETTNIKWTQNMTVEEGTIDKQHQLLLNNFDKLVKASSKTASEKNIAEVREIIHFLAIYIKEHLDYEEKYMGGNKYPDLERHKEIHKIFIGFFDNIHEELKLIYTSKEYLLSKKLKQLSEDARKFLGEWFINHILVVDQQYHNYMKKIGKTDKKIVVKNDKKVDIKKKSKTLSSTQKSTTFDMSTIKAEIQQDLKQGNIEPHEAEIKEQRAPAQHIIKIKQKRGTPHIDEYIRTGVPGFDELFEHGIPKGNAVLVAGGAGSGKTIFCLQSLANHASNGEKCLYMSFEESEERLIEHMEEFGWDAKEMIKKKNLFIKRFNPFDITRSVDALLMKAKGELLIDIDPVVFPNKFKPDFIVVDSLTAIASAFTGKEDSYRIYIEQLFRFFEKIKSTAFLITETKQIPDIFSTTGVEEFLADGVVVIYNFKRGDVRENAIEVLKMRGEKHQKKIVAMQITEDGMVVYPEQEVFEGMD